MAGLDPYQRWRKTWLQIGAEAPNGVIDRLVVAYTERHRAYHTLHHLSECFAHLDACPDPPDDSGSLELALWFHDAIYDTKAFDNEARSAAWALIALESLPCSRLERIESLILATRHDTAPSTRDEQLLLDVDLSILGARPERFDEYESQIRQEYSWVPAAAYRAARARILGQLQDRPALYHTAHFRNRLEARARSNLRRSLDALAILRSTAADHERRAVLTPWYRSDGGPLCPTWAACAVWRSWAPVPSGSADEGVQVHEGGEAFLRGVRIDIAPDRRAA